MNAENVRVWREIAEWDWVQINTGGRLHAVGRVTAGNLDFDAEGNTVCGNTVCGRVGRMFIPGIFSRLGSQRCKSCCKATGMPQGLGSPKNDEALRPLVERRLKALEAAL